MHLVPWSCSDANGCREAPWQDGAPVGQELGAGSAGRRSRQTTILSLSLGNF